VKYLPRELESFQRKADVSDNEVITIIIIIIIILGYSHYLIIHSTKKLTAVNCKCLFEINLYYPCKLDKKILCGVTWIITITDGGVMVYLTTLPVAKIAHPRNDFCRFINI